ncbi:Acetyltransferase (GNAT) domain-containing protein [Paenibacillus catalpae]|uniref:Acetyltransferase (GNAT) domain-containing protein n=2 Tax=Paenibacillus catalpae TaxID=1045775 RepID=A0A1I1XQI8_9BACL|nr:Acetyltransferase (GNAT) domain-containing protein [Paenibacillus catalpae]
MSSMQNLIVNNLIRAYERLGELSQLLTFIKTDRTQRFESDVPFELFNSVVNYEHSEGIDLIEEIKAIKSMYHNRGQKLRWLTYSHKPDEVVNQALAANDLKQSDVLFGLGLDLDGWRLDLPEIPGLEVRPVREPQELEDYRKTILAGFSIPEPMADIFCKVFVDGPSQNSSMIQHYIAYLDGVPVTTLSTFIDGDVAGIYSIATVEAYRSRGMAQAVLTHALDVVQQKGAKLAVIHATPMGRKVYQRVGFKEELTITIHSS